MCTHKKWKVKLFTGISVCAKRNAHAANTFAIVGLRVSSYMSGIGIGIGVIPISELYWSPDCCQIDCQFYLNILLSLNATVIVVHT